MLEKTREEPDFHQGVPRDFSLNSGTIQKIFHFARPLGHHEDPQNANLGFGFLYYGLVRVLRPNRVLVIGSGFGFSVVCLALGLKDNGTGRLDFVDPSYSLFRHGPMKTIGGRGRWDNPEQVHKHFSLFDVQDLITHHKMRTDEYFPRLKSPGYVKYGLAFIDGNHAFENVKYDFMGVLAHSKKNTYICMHDTNIYIRELIRNAGVKRWLDFIQAQAGLFEIVDFPFSSGVAIVRVLKDSAWDHLRRLSS